MSTTGTVKWFSADKGFGRITADTGAEVFVHFSDIEMSGRKNLEQGQRVEFEIVQDTKGPKAQRVRPVGAQPAARTSAPVETPRSDYEQAMTSARQEMEAHRRRTGRM